jgi:hypothetical protein
MDNIELQQDLERYASQLTERVAQALEPLERSPRAAISDAALKHDLLCASAAIDIATGPYPEVNLLDMIVFVRLSREVVEEYWVPSVYGDAGGGLQDAYRQSEDELWSVADKIMDEPKKRDLVDLIDQWRAANPEQVRVEGLRLGDFAGTAGEAARARAARATGLLKSVRSATQAADQALLLAERGKFLVCRLPFLMRLQVRLAAREIVSDAVSRLEAVVAKVPGAELVGRVVRSLRSSNGAPMFRRGEASRDRSSEAVSDEDRKTSPPSDGRG